MLDQVFADIATGFSATFGGPFHQAQVIDETGAVYDDGGSIVTPGTVSRRDCLAQGDAVTQRMREAAGYTDKDIAVIVLGASLQGSLGTDARIEILEGPHAGVWMVELLELDPVAIGWVGRGRRA